MKAAEKTDGKPPQQTTGEDGKEVDGWSKEKQLEVVRKAIEESHNGTGVHLYRADKDLLRTDLAPLAAFRS